MCLIIFSLKYEVYHIPGRYLVVFLCLEIKYTNESRIEMKKTILLAAILGPALVSAHSGHGAVEHGIGHYLLTPFHLSAFLTAAVIGIGAYLYIKNRKRSVYVFEQRSCSEISRSTRALKNDTAANFYFHR